MSKPTATIGMHHLGLSVINLEACVDFYTVVLGMDIVWQPDPDNIYLSSGNDNLALHRAKVSSFDRSSQALDHLGFFLQSAADVDAWHDYLVEQNVNVVAKPKEHRDGSRSLYCKDPDGNVVQLIYMG